jgi:hypothetical protein
MTVALTPEVALQIGGFDLRYARVLALAVVGDTAVLLTDPNGDGNHHDLQHLYLLDGQWTGGSSGGGGASDDSTVHGWGYNYTPDGRRGVRYAFGLAEHPGPQLVTIEVPAGYPKPAPGDDWWVERPLEVTATAEGWWLWIEPFTDSD